MIDTTLKKHFIPGNKVRLEFVSDRDSEGVIAIEALISTVHGEVVIVELPSDGAVTLLRSFGSLELTLGSFGGDMFCRCLATMQGGSMEKLLLLYVEEILETIPQRRDEYRVDVEAPFFFQVLNGYDKLGLDQFWQSLNAARQGQVAPLLRHNDSGDYVAYWEGTERVARQPLNISAGGVMFYSNKPLQAPQRFHADIFLPDESGLQVVPVLGRVIRCRKLSESLEPPALLSALHTALGPGPLHRVASCFEQVSARHQDMLVRYSIKIRKQ